MIPDKRPERSVEKRGGTGSASKLDPDPHTTHSPRKIQGVCW
jgi:hypothetical protein